MEFIFSNRFKKDYKKISLEDKSTVANKLRIMAENPIIHLCELRRYVVWKKYLNAV